MNVRSVIITVMILAGVGALAVVAQLSDRIDLLSRVNFFKEEAESTDAQEQTVNNEPDTLMMEDGQARAEEPLPSEEKTNNEESQPSVGEVAGAHDVEVTADTGAGSMIIWISMAAMLLGLAGVVTAKYAI